MRAFSPEVTIDVLDLRNCFDDSQNYNHLMKDHHKKKCLDNDSIEEIKCIDISQEILSKTKMRTFKEQPCSGNRAQRSALNHIL